jgi:hypothetical protein
VASNRSELIYLFAIDCILKSTVILDSETNIICSLNFLLETSLSNTSKVTILIAFSRNFSNNRPANSMILAKKGFKPEDKTGNRKLIRRSLLNIGNDCFTAGLYEHCTRHYYRNLRNMQENVC